MKHLKGTNRCSQWTLKQQHIITFISALPGEVKFVLLQWVNGVLFTEKTLLERPWRSTPQAELSWRIFYCAARTARGKQIITGRQPAAYTERTWKMIIVLKKDPEKRQLETLPRRLPRKGCLRRQHRRIHRPHSRRCRRLREVHRELQALSAYRTGCIRE